MNQRKEKAMKKLICILLSTVLMLSLFGCMKKSQLSNDTTEPAKTLDTDESTVLTESSTPDETEPSKTKYLLGIAIEVNSKEAPELSTLVLDVDTISEEWGDTVLVYVSGPLDEEQYYVDAEIEVQFTEYEESNNPAYSYIITAIKTTNMAFAVYKPIIYLYPEASTVCSVSLTLNGRFTCTYPEYDNGWNNFTAHPDGTLVFPDGKEYYALYWEGMQNADWDLTEGFCVRGEDTAEFLEWALSEQGLSRREANEFIVYWLPLMQNNPYNVISFQTKAYTDTAVLDVSPKPDSVLLKSRVKRSMKRSSTPLPVKIRLRTSAVAD